MTLVKVCGVNRADDLAVAVEAGADLIGFILVDWSPRAITRAAAAELATQVPDGVGRVGVFVDEDPATVAAIADELALDYVQLHGSEAPPVVESFGSRAIKAHRLPKDGDLYGATILLDRHFDAAPTARRAARALGARPRARRRPPRAAGRRARRRPTSPTRSAPPGRGPWTACAAPSRRRASRTMTGSGPS